MPRKVHRQCTLCEAHCGIDVEVDGDRVVRITGDADDPISRGYICPKAAALADLYADPDRLRRPVRRVGSEWEEIGWDEALDMAADGLRAVQRRHGNDAVATYFGNPSAHTMSGAGATGRPRSPNSGCAFRARGAATVRRAPPSCERLGYRSR